MPTLTGRVLFALRTTLAVEFWRSSTRDTGRSVPKMFWQGQRRAHAGPSPEVLSNRVPAESQRVLLKYRDQMTPRR